MKQVLFEDTEYPYLQERAAKLLKRARAIAREYQLDKMNVFDLGGNNICVLPWMGHISYYTLLKLIRKFMSRADSDDYSIKKISGYRPCYITFKLEGEDNNPQIFLERLKSIVNSRITPEKLVDQKDIRQLKKQFEYKEPKYDRYITPGLLKKQVIEDYIDLDFLKNQINNWKC
jgi:ATP-dependent Lhr-like helicase